MTEQFSFFTSLNVCMISIFPLHWDQTSVYVRRGAFRLKSNPPESWISMNIVMQILILLALWWGFSHLHLVYSNPRLWYWSLTITPLNMLLWIMISFMAHSKQDTSPLHSHEENPSEHEMNHPLSSVFRCLSGVRAQRKKITSLLQGRPGQLIGQRVPALYLLALVLQTVYPVLQSLSLWVTPKGHSP